MFDYIEKVRRQPPHARMRTALMWAGGLTLIIFVGWLIFLPHRFGKSTSVSSDESSWGGVWSDLSSGWQDVHEAVTNLTGSSTPFVSLFSGASFSAENPAATAIASGTDSGPEVGR